MTPTYETASRKPRPQHLQLVRLDGRREYGELAESREEAAFRRREALRALGRMARNASVWLLLSFLCSLLIGGAVTAVYGFATLLAQLAGSAVGG